MALSQPIDDEISLIPSPKKILLLGETGAGKSTLGNALTGTDAFKVGHSLDSCTSDILSVDGFLFGDPENIRVNVGDSGGLGDSEGRDGEFLDALAIHIRSKGGIHGIVYVQNACNTRISKQTQDSLQAMVATLTDLESREDLGQRLTIVLTQCTDPLRQTLWENKLRPELRQKFDLCHVPFIWYDSFDEVSSEKKNGLLLSLLSSATSLALGGTSDNLEKVWKEKFASWVERLPSRRMGVPSETERENLKKEHKDNMALQRGQVLELQRKLSRAKAEARSAANQSRKQQQELQRKIQLLSEKLYAETAPTGCFSGSSRVVEKNLGTIAIKDLVVGSQVATVEGWATVTTFLHWHPDQEIPGIKIKFSLGELTLTPEHMVFTKGENGRVQVIPAKDVKRHGNVLTLSDGQFYSFLVQSIEPVSFRGYYAPITTSGTIIVENIVASCYTQDGRYSVSHWTTHMIMAPLRLVLPSWLTHVPGAGDIHPYARFLLML